jgi:pyruvate decarboxylase
MFYYCNSVFTNATLQLAFRILCSQVRTEEELKEALKAALGPKKDCLCFIEVIVHKDDTSKELLEWGSRVSAANSRPPNPQ